MSSQWKEVELGSLINVLTDYHSNGAYKVLKENVELLDEDNYALMVRTTNFEQDNFLSNNKYITREAYEFMSKSKVYPDDLIMNKIANAGSIYYMPNLNRPVSLAMNLFLIRINNDLANSRFVYYNLKANEKYVKSFAQGSVTKTITKNAVKNLRLNLPPLPEQKAIAHILGTLDDKIELNRKMNETLEQMAQALFKRWFVDFDPVLDNALAAGNEIPEALKHKAEKRKVVLATNKYKALPKENMDLFPSSFVFNEELDKWIPEGWRVKSFGDFYDCYDNKRIPLSKAQREEKKPGIYPYYGATSINDYIDEYIFDDKYLLLGEDGSVMREDGTPFTQYVWGKIWVNNHAHVLQGRNGVTTEHLLTFIRVQNINAFVTGAVQLKINQGNMKRIPFLFSSDEINKAFGKQIEIFYDKYRINFDQIESLTIQRDVLLPQLISGQLRLKN